VSGRLRDERSWARYIDRLQRQKLDDELQTIARAYMAVDRAVARRHAALKRST
jgi:hypothetical protein